MPSEEEPVPSVGMPGPQADPYLFVLVAELCVGLLAWGLSSLIALHVTARGRAVRAAPVTARRARSADRSA